jgi:hypothetical protein
MLAGLVRCYGSYEPAQRLNKYASTPFCTALHLHTIASETATSGPVVPKILHFCKHIRYPASTLHTNTHNAAPAGIGIWVVFAALRSRGSTHLLVLVRH